MSISLIAGIIGMLCILVAFILDEFVKKFNQNTVQYNLLNIFGSALLLYYALILHGWPFVILNAVWLTAAFIKLSKILGSSR